MTSSKIRLYHRAIEIYQQYIDEMNATSQINVPAEIRSQIRSELELVGVKLTSLSTPTDPPSSPEIIIRPEHTERWSTTPEPLSTTKSSSELLPFLQSNDTLFEDLVQSYVGLEKNLYSLMNEDSFIRYKESKFYSQFEKLYRSSQGKQEQRNEIELTTQT